jgi:GTP-binding protein
LLGYFEEAPPYFVTSSETMMGRDEVLGFIDDINKNFTPPKFDGEHYK